MKKLSINLLLSISLIISTSCSNNDTTEPTVENLKNVTDCALNYSADDNNYYIGICLDGTNSALPGETITFASKATANFSEIIWTVEEGNIDIINVENSMENSVEIGRLRTVATLRFDADFSGGSIKAEAINNDGEYASITHFIAQEIDQ